MIKFMLISGLVLSSVSLAFAEADHVLVTPDKITWVDGPSSLPPGAQMAILVGDPKAAGPFVMRLKFPAGYEIPPHTHPQDENVTVISGTFMLGMGDDTTQPMTALPEGSFAHMKTGTKHYAKAPSEVIVQLHGTGPWGINYLKP